MALGLLPPPEPKVKLANMMRVLQDQAVSDPSAVERKVRAQVAQREKNHEMRNLARKLTPEERREKALRKLKADAAGDIVVALFRAPQGLSNPQIKFKVDVNAQQWHLSGAVVTVKEQPELNCIVVEGGPKSVKAYVKLLCRRIDWTKRAVQDDDENDVVDDDVDMHDTVNDVNHNLGTQGRYHGDNDIKRQGDGHDADRDKTKALERNHHLSMIKAHTHPSKCFLVWKGVVAKRAFSAFRFQECKTSTTARKVLEAKHVEHYWDMVESFNPLLESHFQDDLHDDT
jgi:U4/U6 small nuclear ribonucleoprotein PRP3